MEKVCIIGGGPAGIMVAGALKGHALVSGFERANDLLGQWADNTDEMTQKHYGSRHSRFILGLQIDRTNLNMNYDKIRYIILQLNRRFPAVSYTLVPIGAFRPFKRDCTRLRDLGM